MAWVYLDDHFDEHPKVLAARDIHRDAPWLFVAGLCLAKRQAQGGLIPETQIPRLITSYSRKSASALIDVGLWDESPIGAQIHGYSKWNRMGEEKSASARNAAQVRWQREREVKAEAERNATA